MPLVSPMSFTAAVNSSVNMVSIIRSIQAKRRNEKGERRRSFRTERVLDSQIGQQTNDVEVVSP